jgi:Glycosyltransferase
MKENKPDYSFLFLYTRLPDYFLQCINYLMSTCSANSKAWVVHYDPDKNAPYEHAQVEARVKLISRSTFQETMIDSMIRPDIIYIAGWSDAFYTQMVRKRKHRIPVVMGLDNQWLGTARQRVATAMSPFWLKKICTTIWVAGIPQFEYARRLGFAPDRIIKGLYCADTSNSTPETKTSPTYNIVYTGRMVGYKRPDWLLKAFTEILQENAELNRWKLTLIGSGPLKETLQSGYNKPGQVEFANFLQPSEVRNIIARADIFCLPSIDEHWGVVVQEAAAAGLPLLLSDTCGAASEFLINGFNGYQFKSRDYQDFKKKLYWLMTKTSSELQLMGEASKQLSKRITHESWAANFKSVLINGTE